MDIPEVQYIIDPMLTIQPKPRRKRKGRMGRPPKPLSQQVVSRGFSLSPILSQALDAAAAKTGRSASAVVCEWIRRGAVADGYLKPQA